MQDYEYMYKVRLCSVLEDRSHMETLFTGFKWTCGKGGSVCRVWYGLIYELRTLQTENLASQKTRYFRIGWQRKEIGFHFGLKYTTVHVTPDTHWSALSLAYATPPPVRLTSLLACGRM